MGVVIPLGPLRPERMLSRFEVDHTGYATDTDTIYYKPFSRKTIIIANRPHLTVHSICLSVPTVQYVLYSLYCQLLRSVHAHRQRLRQRLDFLTQYVATNQLLSCDGIGCYVLCYYGDALAVVDARCERVF